MDVMESLIKTLTLEAKETDLFRGFSPDDKRKRVFGGQVLAQGLLAAEKTISGRPVHSLHAYFLRPGDPLVPIDYKVERTRDGGSFSVRRITALQDGTIIFVMAASFQKPEPGFDHQSEMPKVVDPESLPGDHEWRAAVAKNMPEPGKSWMLRERAIEIRPVEPADRFTTEKRPPRHVFWFRARRSLPDDAALHRAVLAYASDMTLLDSSLLPHGVSLVSPEMQLASLDHALWFHRPVKADEWMLSVQDSPSASGARGFNRALIYARDGALIASAAQEGLIRFRGKR